MKRTLLLLLAGAMLLCGQSIPRPEYPQPQFEREQWLTLNGAWEFEFDDQNQGLAQGWGANTSRKFSRTITVPFPFESARSGIGDTSFHPWVWYRRTFQTPKEWVNRRVLLHFGAVDYRAQVWVNGQKMGEHTGGHVPFTFDITDVLSKTGSNTITVRAEDPPTDRSIPRGKQYWQPKSSGIFYTRTSGIWQPVWLEATGESYFKRVRITPKNDGSVRFDALLMRHSPELEFVASIVDANGALASTTARTVTQRPSAGLAIAAPRLWSPENPNLYNVVFELRRGNTVLDRVKSYFGYREVHAENGRVMLNGRPIYLKTVLDQGYWPDTTITPPSDEAMQYDIKVMKEMGFNGARKHQKVEDPRFLYWADKLGYLVSGEMPNAFPEVFTEDYVQEFMAQWLEAMERDYNHPSIIIWAPLNESWGVPNMRDPRQQAHLKSLYMTTRSMDNTRLVVDNDGWEHVDTYDILAQHDYARTGDILLARYGHLKPGVAGQVIPNAGRIAIMPGYEFNGAPFFLSEFGGVAYIPEGAKVPEASWGYAGVEKSQEAALARLRSLWEAIAKIPIITGICYTQVTDVEQEINGLMTYDRKPKFDPKDIKAMNDLLR
jgi:beta-galactosidase/beta-glucuronidase